MTTSTADSKRVKLFLRANAEVGAERTKDAAVETLADLSADGVIEGYDVNVWGRELRVDGPLASTEYGSELLEHIREFRSWAVANGVSLESVFNEGTVTSPLTDEHYEVVSLPTMCLAVYEGGELSGVYPCHDGNRPCSVLEYLEELTPGKRAYAPEP